MKLTKGKLLLFVTFFIVTVVDIIYLVLYGVPYQYNPISNTEITPSGTFFVGMSLPFMIVGIIYLLIKYIVDNWDNPI